MFTVIIIGSSHAHAKLKDAFKKLCEQLPPNCLIGVEFDQQKIDQAIKMYEDKIPELKKSVEQTKRIVYENNLALLSGSAHQRVGIDSFDLQEAAIKVSYTFKVELPQQRDQGLEEVRQAYEEELNKARKAREGVEVEQEIEEEYSQIKQEIEEEYKLQYAEAEKEFYAISENREKRMAAKISATNKNMVVVVGLAHVAGIKKELKKNSNINVICFCLPEFHGGQLSPKYEAGILEKLKQEGCIVCENEDLQDAVSKNVSSFLSSNTSSSRFSSSTDNLPETQTPTTQTTIPTATTLQQQWMMFKQFSVAISAATKAPVRYSPLKRGKSE